MGIHRNNRLYCDLGKRFIQMKPGLTVPVVFPASGPPRRMSHGALYFCCYSAC